MVPLAAVATVVPAAPPAPPSLPSKDPSREWPVVPVIIAFVVLAGAFVVNSPLLGLFGPDNEGAWVFLGFCGEAAAVAAILGMLFRQPGLAWGGAGLFFFAGLSLASQVWAGHILALLLLGAVAAWELPRRARLDREARSRGWQPL